MKQYRVELSKNAQKQLKKLPPQIRQKIVAEIRKLETNRFPAQFKVLTGKKTADYRLRAGDYRILYDVYDKDETVLILVVGHRRDVYR